MNFKKIIVTKINNIATEIRLNDPDVHNALTLDIINELSLCIDELSQDTSSLILISANGKSFCAGGDLSWMKKQLSAPRENRVKEASKLADLLLKLYNCPKTIIGKVEGNAFGGGIGIMSICDFVFSVKDIKMALTEAKLGLIPATISPYVVRKIGEKNSIHLFTSAKIFSPEDGVKFGLIDFIYEKNEINSKISEFLDSFKNSAPNSILESKKLVRDLSYPIDQNIVDLTINKLADIWDTKEAKEGINAFFNKKKPNWIKE